MGETAKQLNNNFLINWVDLNIACMDMKIALRGAHGGKDKGFLLDSMPECKQINADSLADAAARDVSAVLRVMTRSGFGKAAQAARESAADFDKWCDNELISYIRSARYKTFGFEPIFSFLIGKRFELQAARIILSRFKSGIPAELIKERLRDSYV